MSVSAFQCSLQWDPPWELRPHKRTQRRHPYSRLFVLPFSAVGRHETSRKKSPFHGNPLLLKIFGVQFIFHIVVPLNRKTEKLSWWYWNAALYEKMNCSATAGQYEIFSERSHSTPVESTFSSITLSTVISLKWICTSEIWALRRKHYKLLTQYYVYSDHSRWLQIFHCVLLKGSI